MARNKITQPAAGMHAQRGETCAAPRSEGPLSDGLRPALGANRLSPIRINARTTPLAPVWGSGRPRVVDIKPNETAPAGFVSPADAVRSLIAVSKQLVG